MVANYALTAWLAASGLDRARHNPLLPLAMGIKLVLDGVTNVELARQEWSENKAFCEYYRRCDGLLDRVHSTRSTGVITLVGTLLGRRDLDTKAQNNTR